MAFLWFSSSIPISGHPHEGGAAASGQCGDLSLRSAGETQGESSPQKRIRSVRPS